MIGCRYRRRSMWEALSSSCAPLDRPACPGATVVVGVVVVVIAAAWVMASG